MTSSKSLSLSVLILAAVFASQAGAADAPKRKSGLWEMKSQMSGMPAGMPNRGPIQMCVDQASDNVMQEKAKEKSNCSVMDVNRGVGKITIHSVCKYEGTTATTDAVITGDMDSNYKSDMTHQVQSAAARHGYHENHPGSPLARPLQGRTETW
jgi:hypothetical protein